MRFLTSPTSLAALALLLTAGTAGAGPLNPPAGPIASTYKTLQDAEPRTAINATNTPGTADSAYRITQPGSYYLTGDLVVTGDRHGIVIAAHNVTIDLNGFSIRGSNAEGRAGIIGGLHQLRNINIRNGSIRDFALAGVSFSDHDDWSRPRLGRIEHLRISNCGVGIGPGGEYTVADCNISGGATGIYGWGELLVERCHVTETSGVGIFSLTGSTTVRQCRIDDPGTHGVQITQGIVEACEIVSPGQNGVHIFSSGVVRACSISTAAERGIVTGLGSLIESNRVHNYGDAGIRADQCSRIVNNLVFYSLAVNPTSTQVAIEAPTGGCHIEGNTITKGDIGIQAQAGGNLIIRNAFSGIGTVWSLSGTNSYGPLAGGGGQFSTTNPLANVTY